MLVTRFMRYTAWGQVFHSSCGNMRVTGGIGHEPVREEIPVDPDGTPRPECQLTDAEIESINDSSFDLRMMRDNDIRARMSDYSDRLYSGRSED